ncbi:HD-GYP domain-containing protein [Clostridium ganghwense]|uniref:HD-GYP domain-containing protein n=1 Tax=Clostridium ganghwense TaxID=312089 RepID=A0ABT4CS80_9CLOT|nr:HD-GYP domain-containing protein [Clostridium ganghwense]MCY6371927.1 HD-GYP domain-containing protein [Clostridium ganghwense]
MRLEFLRNLKGDEILAKDILNGNGEVLLKAGYKLNSGVIAKLRKCGIFILYIEDERFSDISIENDMIKQKKAILKQMPKLFNTLIDGHKFAAKQSIDIIEKLIDEIISLKSINDNLYEFKIYDNYTYIHCVDTGIMSVYLGAYLKLNNSELKELGLAAVLHDIGKMRVPNEIINKTTKLIKEEFEEIKKHPIYGKEILSKTNVVSEKIIHGVVQHHERIDGKGYPYGLLEHEISDYAKIITVSDVFTAITADRSYRKKINPKEAYELILGGMGTRFDQNVIEAFKKSFAIYPLGCCVKLSNGVEGYVVRQNKNLPDRPVIRVVYDSVTKQSIQFYEIDLMKHLTLTIEGVV